MSSYDWSQFHVRMYYHAPLAEVWRRFATARGLESFFIYQAVHTAPNGAPRGPDDPVQEGDRYEWDYLHNFAHDGQFQLVQPERRLRFTFGSPRVDISFREVDAPGSRQRAVEVELHQVGCATTDPARAWEHLNCRSCWIYFLTNLRSVLAGGPDLRDFEQPLWNDSVSIGFQVDAGPGSPRPRR